MCFLSFLVKFSFLVLKKGKKIQNDNEILNNKSQRKLKEEYHSLKIVNLYQKDNKTVLKYMFNFFCMKIRMFFFSLENQQV